PTSRDRSKTSITSPSGTSLAGSRMTGASRLMAATAASVCRSSASEPTGELFTVQIALFPFQRIRTTVLGKSASGEGGAALAPLLPAGADSRLGSDNSLTAKLEDHKK